MHNINIFLFTLINQGAGQYPLLDGIFVWLTSYISYVVVAVVFLIILYSAFKTNDPLRRIRWFGELGEVSLSLFLVWVIVTILKVTIAFPRPFVSLPHVKTLIEAAPYVSFPSAHAALTMALAVSLLPYHKHLGHLLIAFSLIVALSRVFVGVHYPFDIGVGLLIGYLVPKLIHRVFAK
jgi:undecaprenyl-diphosphatase